MAAIWGVISRERQLSEKAVCRMQDSMQEFKIDRYDSLLREKVYFACGHQYFTKEAEHDISPYYDEATHTYFAADCYLYNRSELIQALVTGRTEDAAEEMERCGDAMLAYRAYRKWGEGFVERIRGSFAFVIYEQMTGQVLLYADHLAQRYLAYYSDEEEICFATVYQPLLAFLGKRKTALSREWIAAAYTDCTADTFKLPGRTVYEKIYHVEPGQYVRIGLASGRVEKCTYWNPLRDAPKLPRMKDEEYKQYFLSVFDSAVKSLLRARGEIGIMLSGGLDSSSVAALAARNLAKEKKFLYSYTAVPADGYEYHNSKFYIENEKELVLAQQKLHPNLIPHFVNAQESNCFSRLQHYAECYREPVKPALNMINVEGMTRAAAEDGCSILLSGQNGNATISYGSILSYLYQKGMSGHWIAAYKEAKAFCRRRGVAGKKLLQVFLQNWKEEKFEKVSFGSDCLVKEEDIRRFRLLRLEKKIRAERGTGGLDSRRRRRGFCFMPLVFQHMGFYGTYNSLRYGVLSLDPTLTKEMIELCVELPIDCNVRGGKERRMVRDYMKGYVPESILENHTGRGVQGADYAYRVNRDWDKMKDGVYDILTGQALGEYLDRDKLHALVEEAKANEYHMDKNLVARLAVISSLGYFVSCERSGDYEADASMQKDN